MDINIREDNRKAKYHLPGLFEFYELYRRFLPLYREHPEYFYDWCEIGSVYGAPGDCLWGGGRVGFGDADPEDVLQLMREYGISARLTFSNSLLREEHLSDRKCNELCRLAGRANSEIEPKNSDELHNPKGPRNSNELHNPKGPRNSNESHNPKEPKNSAELLNPKDINNASRAIHQEIQNGVIVASDLLLTYLRDHYPELYLVSSTTKVLTDWTDFEKELDREEFSYVVPDFRLNKAFDRLAGLPRTQKNKIEFLCNECCYYGCADRKACYENVSAKCLGETEEDHICQSPTAARGYRFSDAMKNPGFIGMEDIRNIYLPMGFTNYKIEGRSLGSALILEFLLYYMTKPEYQLKVREEIYLDAMLDLF